jgi:GTP-binding protein Era
MDVHVERESQKGILIGKQGTMLQRIGTEARMELEAFLGQKVVLKLHIRVTPDWKDRESNLRSFGYV